MITLKPRHGLLAGLALILLSNAVALGGAWYNRQGEPESRLQLSERELWRSHDGTHRENSGLSLHLNWRIASDPEDPQRFSQQLLDETTLLALGFTRHQGSERRWHQPRQRPVLIVLELDGPAYQRELKQAELALQQAQQDLAGSPDSPHLREQLKYTRLELDNQRERASRLFAVAAGTDLQALRQRYPDRSRYAIVGGTVRAWCDCDGTQPHRLRGQIDQLHVTDLNVPAAWRQELAERMPRRHEDGQLPLHIEISYGQRLEPWISAVRLLDKTSSGGDGNATPR